MIAEISYNGYKGSVEFSEDDQVWHGKILDIHDVVTYEADFEDGLQEAFEEAVDEYVYIKDRID